MKTLAIVCQIVVGLSVLDVWLLRYRKPTRWRGGSATNMTEEFRYYGIPDWLRILTGITKVLLAGLLIAGVWYTPVTVPAAAMMSLLMGVAVWMHIRVKDSWMKSLPAFTMLLLSAIVVIVMKTPS